MIDPFVLLTPLLVSPIVVLFVFVGCALTHHGLPTFPPTVILDLQNPDDLAITQVEFDVSVQAAGGTTTTTAVTLTPPANVSMTGPALGSSYTPLISLARPPRANPGYFRYSITEANTGTWTVRCTVSVSGVTPALSNSHSPRTLFNVTASADPEVFAFVVRRDGTGTLHVDLAFGL